MTDREKLVELLTDDLPRCENPLQYTYDEIVERLADYLLAHGVTIQRWIPVTERFPKNGVVVLISLRCDAIDTGWYCSDVWHNDYATYEYGEVTHWMPLPQAPKTEENT